MNVDSAKAQIKSSEAALVQARSQLHTAEVNREHTVITAPIDGIVIQRAVELGQTVNAGMSAPTLGLAITIVIAPTGHASAHRPWPMHL